MYVAALRIFTGPWTLPSVAVVEARILVEVVHLIACCGVNLTFWNCTLFIHDTTSTPWIWPTPSFCIDLKANLTAAS